DLRLTTKGIHRVLRTVTRSIFLLHAAFACLFTGVEYEIAQSVAASFDLINLNICVYERHGPGWKLIGNDATSDYGKETEDHRDQRRSFGRQLFLAAREI